VALHGMKEWLYASHGIAPSITHYLSARLVQEVAIAVPDVVGVVVGASVDVVVVVTVNHTNTHTHTHITDRGEGQRVSPIDCSARETQGRSYQLALIVITEDSTDFVTGCSLTSPFV